MGDYDIDQIFNHIRNLGQNALNGEWGSKQDLYRIRELLDQKLHNAPTFPNEQEWLTVREKQRIINILSK